MKKALYRKIPCWFDIETTELVGRNILWNILLDIMIWWDINIIGIEEFPVWLEVEEK